MYSKEAEPDFLAFISDSQTSRKHAVGLTPFARLVDAYAGPGDGPCHEQLDVYDYAVLGWMELQIVLTEPVALSNHSLVANMRR